MSRAGIGEGGGGMRPMTLGQVAGATGAACAAGFDRASVSGVSTDSRSITSGDLFFAIPGERFDGHDFVDRAVASGAAACVVQSDRLADLRRRVGADPVLLGVDDVVKALGRLASFYRLRMVSPTTVVVAVTGSNGKTTTKQMIDHVLGPTFAGRASPKSFNNHIGVPLTLLAAEPQDRYLVCELGTNAPGEIASLAAMVSPNVAVITSIGEAHLEKLGSIDGVAIEKTSLLDFVRPGGMSLVNIDRPEVRRQLRRAPGTRLLTFGFDPTADRPVKIVSSSCDRTVFEVSDRFGVTLNMPGHHHATNAASAFVVAHWFGIAPEDIGARLATFTPMEGRTHVIEWEGLTIIDDAYNANPSSMLAAVEVFRFDASRRRVFVFGDMLELGGFSASLHRRVAEALLSSGIEVVVGVGEAATAALRDRPSAASTSRVICCRHPDSVVGALSGVLREGDRVWVKGSRGMALDKVVGGIQSSYRRQAAVA